MLVSAICKFNAVNNANNTKNAFSGDKNAQMIDKCKPNYDIKSGTLANRIAAINELEAKEYEHKLNLSV